MIRLALVFAVCCFAAGSLLAAPPDIDRKIGKEPVYKTKSPKYGLVVFGPEGKNRVWLVLDGDTLYVDRNGNGDLTEAGKKIAAEKRPKGDSDGDGYSFDVGELHVGGHTHKGLFVSFVRLKLYADAPLGALPEVKAVLAKEPNAFAVRLAADVEVPGMKGGGLGGRLSFEAGATDLGGVLQFADRPADAPVICFGGPLEVTFYGELPNLRVGRGTELVLVVGAPGIGPGTFAMLGYEDTIPADAKPVAEFSVASAKEGAPMLTERWVIKGRC